METLTELLAGKKLTLFDQGVVSKKEKLTPFAYTDLFTHQVNQTRQPIIHFWEMENTVILGMKDTRVTFLAEGLKVFKNNQYHALARNSGGLAVVSDKGILNVSLIIPNPPKDRISIAEGYTYMLELIRKTFANNQIEIVAKEISDSYCPGEYDLSIDGIKFAGISQRRIKDALSVMIYLSVTGNQSFRGELIKEFYQVSLKEKFGENGYPPVRPAAMANLEDLLGEELTIPLVKKKLLHSLAEITHLTIQTASFADLKKESHFENNFKGHFEKMEQRNKIITAAKEE